MSVQYEVINYSISCNHKVALYSIDIVNLHKIGFVFQFQINAAATVVGRLLPAWYPPCHNFFQVGLAFMGPNERPHMIEVSADGVIQCENLGGQCPYAHLHVTEGHIVVELKCKYPEQDLPHMPYDCFPIRYVTQCLSEMAAFQAELLILACWTPSTTNVYLVKFDETLWNELYEFSCELYAAEHCKVPLKWHWKSKDLMPKLRSFIRTHTSLMCVLPSVKGEEGSLTSVDPTSAYAETPNLRLVEQPFQILLEESQSCLEEAKIVFTSCYNALREPASEVLLWMLSCKDRMQEKNVPNSAPLCYHMKGKHFSMATARELVEKVRDKLKENEVNVLCENYDGQFHSVIVRSIDGDPLTLIQVQKVVWSTVALRSKDFVLSLMLDTNSLSNSDLDILRVARCLPEGKTYYTNLCVEKYCNPMRITIGSRGGPNFKGGVADKFKFVPVTSAEIVRYTEEVVARRKQAKIYGLKNDERNILSAIHPDLLEDVDVDIFDDYVEELEEDELPDLNDRSNPLKDVLSNEHFLLLEHMLQALKDFHPKWHNKTINDLYPDLLTNANKLNQDCTKNDLEVMAKVLSAYTPDRTWYVSSKRKAYNVNLVAAAFESTIRVADVSKRRKKFTPQSLLQLCRKELMKTSYPALSLKVSYANILHDEKMRQWKIKATVPMNVEIPFRDERMDLFAYPEFSVKRGQIECRSFDPVHLLTKVRGHLIKSGYSYTSREAFRELATKRPDILSRSIVFDHIDPQNAFIAERVISERVERELRSMGHTSTADFLYKFRFFFRSTNDRGMSADERVCWLYTLHQFLLENTSFDTYPPKHTQYVNGMPIQTFEGILQLISTRISLYGLAEGKTYNVRSCTTLPVESKFSDITRLDREGHLYPKACNMSKLIGRAVTVNYIKHNPQKAYEICTSNKSAYPVHLAEDDRQRWETEDEHNFDGVYKDHYFDYIDEHCSHRVRRTDVTTGINPMRNVQGVRQWFRSDESKINPMHRSLHTYSDD